MFLDRNGGCRGGQLGRTSSDDVADVAGQVIPNDNPSQIAPPPPMQSKIISNQQLADGSLTDTQNNSRNDLSSEIFERAHSEDFYFEIVLGKVAWVYALPTGSPPPRSTISKRLSRAIDSSPSTWRRPGCRRPATACAPCSSRTARAPPWWSSTAPFRRARWLCWPISSAAVASSPTTPASRRAGCAGGH